MNKTNYNHLKMGEGFIERGISLNWQEDGAVKKYDLHTEELRRLLRRSGNGEIAPQIGYFQGIAMVVTENDVLPETFSITPETKDKTLRFYALPSGVLGLKLPEGASDQTHVDDFSIARVEWKVNGARLAKLPLKYLEFKDRVMESVKEKLDPGNASFTMIDEELKSRFPDLTPNQQRILLVLARETVGRHDEEEGRRRVRAEMSFKDLAEKTGTSKSTVQRCVSDLREEGVIAAEGEERFELEYKLR